MNASDQNRVNNSTSQFRQLLASHRYSLGYVALFSLFINLLFLVPPLYMLQIYDRVLTSRSSETLVVITFVVVWLFLTMGLLEFVRSRMLVRLGSRLDAQLSGPLYETITRLALAGPEQATTRPLHDLASVRQFVSSNAPFALFDTPWVTVYLGILFLFHPAFGWFALAATVVLLGLAVMQDVSTRGLQEKYAKTSLHSVELAAEQLRNAEVLHAMGMQGAMHERWRQQHQLAIGVQSAASDRAGIWVNISKTLRLLFQSLMLGLGAYLALGNVITGGMVIAGSILMGRALAPVDQLIAHWRQFNGARAAFSRLEELLTRMSADAPRMALPVPSGEITIENAVLVPPESENPVLKGISFRVGAGETLVIIGHSAAGKSTLVRAMLGLWPLTAGSVRLDQSEITHWDRVELGRHIGYLPQDIELFDGSVAENIARFGHVKHRAVIKAARVAGVHEMISSLPEGYNTRIGPGGATLSGGQRQGIGLARAVYGRPRLVVLDEPNSNLDSDGEQALRRGCRYLKKHGVTVIMVNHRSRSLGLADKILVMEQGRLKLFGPRDAVLEHMGSSVADPKVARRHIRPAAAHANGMA